MSAAGDGALLGQVATGPVRRKVKTGQGRLSFDMLLTGALLAFAAAGLNAWPAPWMGAVATAMDILAMVVFLTSISLAVTGSRASFALNSLNRYSLSRLQMAAWTAIVFGSLLAGAEWNLFATAPGPGLLEIAIPRALLAAMGISVASATIAPAILSIKANNSPPATPPQLQNASARSQAATGLDTPLVARNQVVTNLTSASASWHDLFTGDDLALAGRVDLSKVQQALLTAVILAAYTADAMTNFTLPLRVSTLPPLSDGLAELLAISHAGYLAFKAIPKIDSVDQAPV